MFQKQIENKVSILFYVVERLRLFQSPPKTGSVFDMAAIAADARVKNVF